MTVTHDKSPLICWQVSKEMAARVNLSDHAVALSRNLAYLADVQAAVQESVMALVDECTQVASLNVSLISGDLQSQCESLLANNGSYVPRIRVNVSSLREREAGGEQTLARVVELLGDPVSWPADTRNGNFEAFLDMVSEYKLN